MEGLAWRGAIHAFRETPTRAGDPAGPSAGVDEVPDDRMPDVLQVNPDLVGPSSFQLGAK